MRILGLILVLLIPAAGTARHSVFFDPPSMIPVVGFTIGALLLSGAGIPRMFAAVFSSRATSEELKAAIHGWAQARIYAVTAGFIGVIIAGGVLLTELGEPHMHDPASIGVAVLSAFMPLLYGVLLGYGIFLPLQSCLEDRVRELAG